MSSVHRAPAVSDANRVLSRALGRAAGLLGLTGKSLSRTIGASESTVSRLLREDRVISATSKEGELAALVIRLYRSLDALVGNDEAQRLAWMSSYNRALNGIPSELIQRPQGLVNTVDYLDAMRAPI